MSLLILMILQVSILGAFGVDKSCSIKNLQVIEMPPKRNQGPTGDCYAFAGLGLIQNFHCKNLERKCHYENGNDDRLSILDAVGLTNHKRLQSGGHTLEVLSAVLAQQGLFKESCAPFSPILENGSLAILEDGRQSSVEAKWHFLIRKAMESSARAGLREEERKEIAKNLIEKLQLFRSKSEACRDCTSMGAISSGANKNACDIEKATHLASVENSLTKRDISVVAYDLFIPRYCNDQRVPLKPFSAHHFTSDSVEEIRGQIKLAMNKKTPLVTNICGHDLIKTRAKEPASNLNCGPHSIIISGIRENCCGVECNTEYRFYDSANAFGNDEWVSERRYFERLTRRWSFNAKSDGRKDLIWID